MVLNPDLWISKEMKGIGGQGGEGGDGVFDSATHGRFMAQALHVKQQNKASKHHYPIMKKHF